MNALANNHGSEFVGASYIEIVRYGVIWVFDGCRPLGRVAAGLIAILSIKAILVWALLWRVNYAWR